MGLTITDAEIGGITVAQCKGEMDTNTAAAAGEKLDELIERGVTKLLLDFSEISFLSSAGLRVLLAASKKINAANGQLRICHMNDEVRAVFDVTGFAGIIGVFDDVTSALKDFEVDASEDDSRSNPSV